MLVRYHSCPMGVAASWVQGSATSMPCGAGNGLTKEFAKKRSQPSKEQSRGNCEEGNGKPTHPLPSQETWQKNYQRNLWCWAAGPSGRKAPCQKQRLGMNTVQFPFGLFCPFQAELMKQLSQSRQDAQMRNMRRRELNWVGKERGEGKRRMEEKHEIRVGTWNVRTMNAMGKLENVKEEMRRNKLSIMGVSEVRWKDGGDFVSDGYRVMYACGPTCQRGVTVIAEAKVAERVTEIDRFGHRIMVVKVDPVDMVIVQAYLRTTDYEDEEVEKLYDQLEEIVG